jgi:hypothetical protein
MLRPFGIAQDRQAQHERTMLDHINHLSVHPACPELYRREALEGCPNVFFKSPEDSEVL